MKKFDGLILFLFTLIFALSISVTNAQNTEQTLTKKTSFSPYFYINGNIGLTSLWGDLSSYNATTEWGKKGELFAEPKFGGGLNFGYQFSSVFGSRLNLTSGSTKSTGNLTDYEGTFTDLSAQLTINLFKFSLWNKDVSDRFYGFGGVGIMFHTGNATHYAGEYKNTPAVFPAGLGVKIAFNDNLSLNLETSLHYTSTDDLDQSAIVDAPFYKLDGIHYTSLGLTYKLESSGLNKMINNADQVVYKVTPEVLQEKGGKVPYEVSVTFPAKYFSPKAAINVAPVLKYGNQELALVSKTFIGEKVVGTTGDMVPYETGGTYTFKGEFDFIPEMASSNVEVNPVVYIPKADVEPEFRNLASAQFKIADGIIHTEDLAGGNEESLLVDSGYELETVVTETSKLFFPKNLYTYNKRFGLNNKEAATDARDAVNSFLAQGWGIKNITVNAYASPEGEETFNANLSDNRAKVADKYIHKELHKLINAKDSKIIMKDCSGVDFKVIGNGPDWNGFMASLETSDLAEKSAISNVIKSAAPAQKETEIKNMILIYPELENILSPLRRAIIDVNCYEPKRTAEEIEALATTNPEKLSHQELLYAATLTEDLETKTAIYKTAANLYPKCWVAQSNYAFAEIQKGNLSNAFTYLEKANGIAPDNATILNNMGIVHAKQGAWDKAKKYFTKAQDLGANENYNLGVVAIQFGEYNKALELFGTRKCDVNVGLAQLMLEKYEDAKANLSCAEETCKTNYLLAIIGARTSNDAEVFTNLEKAFEINPKLKGKALNDREFISYFDNNEFLSLIK